MVLFSVPSSVTFPGNLSLHFCQSSKTQKIKMVFPLSFTDNLSITNTPRIPKMVYPCRRVSSHRLHLKPIYSSSQHQNIRNNPNTVENRILKTHFLNPIILTTTTREVSSKKENRDGANEERGGFSYVGREQMMVLCGFGYWVQGFRCFPWLALNFHMANNLNLYPSTLQLVQNFGNLPMVAKPLYGLLSDALSIGSAHRIPYISIGVFLQVLSWGSLALIAVAGKAVPTLMAFVLLSNLGASITEVAKDALVAEYAKEHRIAGLQPYALMASAMGGILGNLVGGCFLLKAPPRTMFLIFSILLSLQLTVSLSAREESLGLARPSESSLTQKSVSESIRKQLCDLMTAISEESISQPLTWVVSSITMVPVLSGSIFCYQTQCLNLDPSVIGMSRVIGQLMLLSLTVLYSRYWKEMPMRKLIGALQVLYASSLLLDLVLVRQINVRLGIPNEVFALCFSGLAETLAQFKILPFSVLLGSLCPHGCEGSLTSFSASVLCLSSIFSGFMGIGLASWLGITSGDYSSLPAGILIQFLAALLPLGWIHSVPMSQPAPEKERKRGMSKRTRRNRRVGRVVVGSIFVYRRERESESLK